MVVKSTSRVCGRKSSSSEQAFRLTVPKQFDRLMAYLGERKMRVRFFYNGKARDGEVVQKFRSKQNVHCITVLLSSGEVKTFHEDKITGLEYLDYPRLNTRSG